MDKAQQVGIRVPISAGIMPITSKKQIHKMVNMCGATIPGWLMRIIDKYENDPLSMRDAGIICAAQQILELVSQGVRGIHLYTMNNVEVSQRISSSIESIIAAKNAVR